MTRDAGKQGRLGQTLAVFVTAFHNRSLLWLQLAWLAYNSTEWGIWLTLMVWAYLWHGATGDSLIVLVQLVPCIVVSPYLGAMADRMRAGRVLFLGLLVAGLTMAGTAALIVTGAPAVWIFVLAPFMNIALSAPRPALAALLPSVVRTPLELTAANVVSSWTESVSVLLAPLVTGVLLGVGGTGLAASVLAGITLLGALFVAGIPGPPPLTERSEGVSLTAEVRDGLSAVWNAPGARTLVGVIGSQYIVVGALDVLYVVLAITTLGMGEAGAGYLNSAYGVGGLIGAAITAGLVARRRLAPALNAGMVTVALALGALGLHPTVVGAFILLAIVGLSRTVFDVTGRILLQRAAPPDVIGQVFALVESLMDAGLALGAVLVPALVALSGARAALVGTALLVFVIIAVSWRRLRRIDDEADVPQVQIRLLRSVPLFAPLPAPELEALARALTPVAAPAGTVVMSEGEEGERYYAIETGQVRVSKHGKEVAILGRGDGFGEIALIHEVPRTATVTAVTDVQLYSLEKEPFVVALTGHVPAARAADDLIARRLDELQAF